MPLYLDGHKLSEGQMKRVYCEMDKAIKGISRQAAAIDPHQPWRAEGAKELDHKPVSKWIAGLRCSTLTRVAITEQFTNDGGQPTDQQSFLANLAVIAGGRMTNQNDAYFTQTETLRCSEGNQELAIRLAREVRDRGGSAELSTPVRAIRTEAEGVTLEFDAIGDKTPRSPFNADYAILAIPPSLWPASPSARIAITPELPRAYYVTMGTAVKYLSPLKKRFWIGEGLAPTSTSSRFGVTWEGTDNQIGPPDRPVELSLFAGGGVAKEALAQYASGGQKQVDAFYAPRIGEVYNGYVEQLADEPEFMAWPRDKWTAAGYSCPAPGEVCRAGPLLEKGFGKRLFFAGEHTCFAYFGYMEGALQSGKTAAGAVLKAASRLRALREPRGTKAPPRRDERPEPTRKDLDYQLWYGTNRKPKDPADISKGFSTVQDEDKVHLGICKVFVPEAHKIASSGSWLKQLLGTDDRLKVTSIEALAEAEFWRSIRSRLEGLDIRDRDAVVYIHGYNVTFEGAAIRAAQIGADLAVRGCMAFFSWPSRGEISHYVADTSAIETSVADITNFITDFAQRSGAEKIHLIVHSMGNRAVLQAVNAIASTAAERTGTTFDQVILAAADIGLVRYRQLYKACSLVARRTTLYVSPMDLALRASTWLHDQQCVGLAPPITVEPGVDTVFVTNTDLMSLGHGFITNSRDVLADMHQLLNFGAEPDRRFGLKAASNEGRKYWKL
ncbi:alpha/beta hydrolase [Bradyrhizobium diazoefficiens]|nr:alpha/beta hydrolase [Bradyrhizobium diazoefficiens]MBR0847661.1 alpha/beta hydrolase [Bradyrhizobium diazoefficiens]